MKNGRPSWTAKAAPALVAEVNALIDARDKSARAIYDERNLSRFARFSTFEHYFAVRRREREQRRGPAAGPGDTSCSASCSSSDGPSPQAVDAAIAGCVSAITDALLSGRIGKLDVGKALRSLAELKTLSIREDANRRAAELHATRMAKAKPATEEALRSTGTAAGQRFQTILEAVQAGTMSVADALTALSAVMVDEFDRQCRELS